MFESLLSSINQKLAGYSSRDKKSILALAVSAVLALVIFGVILPLRSQNIALQNNLASAKQTYREIQTLAPLAMASGGDITNLDAGIINTEVRRQAAKSGFDIQRFEPSGDNLKVWLEDVKFSSVITWLGNLETMGITQLELTMEDRSKPGFVSVRVTLGLPS